MSQGIVQEQVQDSVLQAIQEARQKGQLKAESLPALQLEAPKKAEWGDLATTIAMAMAAVERRTPFEIAQLIIDNIPRRDILFERVEIARPGFINFTLHPGVWLSVLREIEQQGLRYGHDRIGAGRRVLIEYVSANPTGPLHVGHGRGAAVGQAVANLLSAMGYDVTSEYYINDAGRQMKLLGASVYARYQALAGRSVPFPKDGYQGAYIQAIAERLSRRIGNDLLNRPPHEAEEHIKALAYQELLEEIRRDLDAFGVTFQSWFSEAALLSKGSVEQVLAELRTKGLVFEEDGAWWFRSSRFGDEKDRVVRKKEGEYTYLASDIAYHKDKLERGYDLLIDVWGADHHGYIPRMQAAVQACGHAPGTLRVVLVQMVHLLRGGTKVEMSKRSGEFVTLRDVISEVGADAAKFFFLMRDSTTHLDFDLQLATQQSRENPVYYVQYAHARIASLWRVAAARGIECPRPSKADLSLLRDADEIALVRKLSAYPAVLQAAATALEPHRVAHYLLELAGQLHPFYFKHRILPPAADQDLPDATAGSLGDETASCSSRQHEVLTPELTGARLALMWAVQQVIKGGLGILGVSTPEQM
ncbi:MAG TPA: arginine--tRNA ligase [Nitrospiraceae bacterium]|nr:arginine--tRNA ligase [Nitrospiraceae bacterium]